MRRIRHSNLGFLIIIGIILSFEYLVVFTTPYPEKGLQNIPIGVIGGVGLIAFLIIPWYIVLYAIFKVKQTSRETFYLYFYKFKQTRETRETRETPAMLVKRWWRVPPRTNQTDFLAITYSRKIFFICVILLIILIPISYTGTELVVDNYLKSILGDNIIARIELSLSSFVGMILIGLGPFIISKESQFYFAKDCIKTISDETLQMDQVQKIRYLILGLDSYNKYLKRNLNLQIKDLDKIYDNIYRKSIDEKTRLITLLERAFEGDKLNVLTEVSKVLLENRETEQFLIKGRLGQKIKDFSAVIIPIITILLTIISLINTAK